MNKKQIIKTFFLIFIQVSLLLLYGCTTTSEQEELIRLFKGQVTIFLKVPEKPSLHITFDLSAVNIVAADGSVRQIMDTPLRIDSVADKGRQIALGETDLTEGTYSKIQFFIEQALVTKMGRASNLAVAPEGIETEINISVKRRSNTTLFLNWNTDASVTDGYRFTPVFTAKGIIPELSTLLVYVSNEGSDNVSVINRQSGEIAATIMVGKKPRGLAVSFGGARSKVYVANSGSDSISVIDPTTNKIENEIPVRFGREPVDIAVANVSSGKELIFVANYNSNNVSVIDGTTNQELEKIDVGRGPVAIAIDPPVDELVRTRFLSFDEINTLRSYRDNFFNVYVANHESNEVSVLRIDAQTGRSIDVINLSVEWKPVDLFVDYQRGKVYVANYGSDKLSVIDILETVKGNISGAVSLINNVGTYITGVISDSAFDRIYLLNERSGVINIMRPFAEGFGSLETIAPPMMGNITVGNKPRSFILDPEGRKFYVVNRGSDSISIVDKTTKREEQVISVGGSPYSIAVFKK